MRRGHPGIGGWRNETPRHFRPRGGGIPRYGYPQQYPRQNPRAEYGVQRQGPRPHRGGLHYNIRSGPPIEHFQHDHDRFVFRRSQPPRLLDRDDRGERHSFTQPPPMRHNDNSHGASQYKQILNHCRINNMGDVDLRQNFNAIESPYKQHPIHQWPNTFQTGSTSFDDRSPYKKTNKYHDNAEGNQIPKFTGHRPPSSDHYGGNVASTIDNSDSFSCSVDDTVDIVRKRLLNRNEPHSTTDIPPVEQNPIQNADTPAIAALYQNEPQTPPAKKRAQRRQNVKSNCDKIKNKIVHQLFKMDKEKIHKLMDNPSSSTKFEYAISSLITESQNSLDRHLRSVAEKSLCRSSEEFIRNDSNTIYEDTFLKQMQCILGPQDTVLLEDIKPLVMAELTKVLQLDEFEQRCDLGEEDPHFHPVEEHPSINYPNEYETFANEEVSKDILMPDYPEEETTYYQEQSYSQPQYATQDTPKSSTVQINHEQLLYEETISCESGDANANVPSQVSKEDHKKARKSAEVEHYNTSDKTRRCETSVPVFDREKARKSADRERNKFTDERRICETPLPVFNANPDPYQISEEEDPFADLDKQYHVAVDHSFIDEDLDKQVLVANDIREYEIEIKSEKDTAQIIKEEIVPCPEIMVPTTVKKEIDNQILGIAKSPLKLHSLFNKDKENYKNIPLPSVPVKREVHDITYIDINNDDPSENQNHDSNNMDNSYKEQSPEFNNEQKESKRSQNSNSVKSTILSNARKRSIDQKPSHRKEKRKKSETTPGEANKQILNKNIIINVNDCGSKSSEKKCDAAKSIFNLFFSKDESGKELPRDNKNLELSDKGYSDKYVKRKETSKNKEHDSKRKRSNSTSHSIVSPRDNIINCSETQSKVDAKNKLKPIDMFVEHPKKVSSTHQAHRNTAQAITPKKVDDKAPVLGAKSKTRRHMATQVVFKMHSKETQTSLLKSSVSKVCQTETKKLLIKATQTNPVTIEKSQLKSSDYLKRMKEIDFEIQELLQEKFQLYSSIDSKESCSRTMSKLGMTVIDVTPNEKKDEVENEDGLSADSIVDDFTSIPVEELEQIALESVQQITSKSPKVQKRNKRQKVLNKTKPNLRSPIPVVNSKNKKKANDPNISLIEQIITDDRPLEEIISLDELECSEDKQTSPAKKKRPQRPQRAPKKKNAKKSRAVKASNHMEQLNIRECSVVLTREDVSTFFNITNALKSEQKETTASSVQGPIVERIEVAEISIPNEAADIQFDMLDVSEDIVVGTVCEVKSSEEKDGSGRDLSTSDDLIIDNSQSLANDAMHADAGQSGECRMFDYSADEMLKRDSVTVTGNADAVLAIECIDNNFIAACLDGNVYYFNGDGQLLATLRGSNLAVTCLTIVREKYGTTIYTGSLDSRIRYYDLDTGLEKGPECNVLSPIQTMDRAWDTVFVGTRTGFVLQFECKNNMLIPISTVKFSEQSILALRALKEGPRKVLLVAARSENVTIKDAQTGLLLRTLEGPKMTVYTLLFEDGKVYCGTSSHQIHTFEYASGSHCGTHEGGKGCVCLRATGGLLFAGCYDGCVYVFREGEPRPFAQLRGPGLMLLSLAVVGTKIIAGYKDRSLYIWKIPLSILKEMIL